jgi:hypothetical protein
MANGAAPHGQAAVVSVGSRGIRGAPSYQQIAQTVLVL